MTKGIIYYSDCRGDERVLEAVRKQLMIAAAGIPVVSNMLCYRDFGQYHKIVTVRPRGYETMFRQILGALEASDADVIFHAEHDVAYHPSHFDFTPAREDTFYYNQNTWRVDVKTGRALHYLCNQVSGLCASRVLLIDHYRRLVAHVEANGFDRSLGFEPGTNTRQVAFGKSAPVETWMSAQPNIDIKTKFCLTPGRWSQEEFRNKQTCLGWRESDGVPGWGVTLGRFDKFLAGLSLAQGAA